jgi:hypothetical protein
VVDGGEAVEALDQVVSLDDSGHIFLPNNYSRSAPSTRFR